MGLQVGQRGGPLCFRELTLVVSALAPSVYATLT